MTHSYGNCLSSETVFSTLFVWCRKKKKNVDKENTKEIGNCWILKKVKRLNINECKDCFDFWSKGNGTGYCLEQRNANVVPSCISGNRLACEYFKDVTPKSAKTALAVVKNTNSCSTCLFYSSEDEKQTKGLCIFDNVYMSKQCTCKEWKER